MPEENKKIERILIDPKASDSDLLEILNRLRVSRGLPPPLTQVDNFILEEIWTQEEHRKGRTLYSDDEPRNRITSVEG